MKNNCNVAKDLMPLCIDGVASEESQQYVEAHIAECTECAVTYGAMKVELPRANQEKERAEMERAAKEMRKKRRKRVIWTGIIGAVLSIALFACAHRVYTNLCVVMDTFVQTDAYEVTVHRLQDDRVVLLFDQKDDQLICGKGAGHGGGVMNVHLYTSRIQRFTDAERNNGGYHTWVIGKWADGKLMADKEQIRVLYAADNNIEKVLIYTEGDEIPEASAELNHYIQVKNDPSNWHQEDYEQMLTELRKTVPEFQ